MEQEDKDLLLKDLCARLPYGVKINAKYSCIDTNIEVEKVGVLSMVDNDAIIAFTCDDTNCYNYVTIHDVKPYLFPLSSMTEEQRKEFLEISHLENRSFYNGEEIVIMSNEVWTFDLGGDADTEYRSIDIKRIRETVKWLDKNHFDWRGLIPMRLAEDATNKNIY